MKGEATCYDCGHQNSGTGMPNSLYQSSYHLNRPVVHHLDHLPLIDYLPNCVVIIVFVGLRRERFLPSARYTHRILLQALAYRAHTSTVFLSLLDNSRVPSHYQASKFYRTIPLLRFRANVRLLSSYTSRNFHPPADPSTGCQLFPSLATTSLRGTLFESSIIMRIRLVRVGLPPAFS